MWNGETFYLYPRFRSDNVELQKCHLHFRTPISNGWLRVSSDSPQKLQRNGFQFSLEDGKSFTDPVIQLTSPLSKCRCISNFLDSNYLSGNYSDNFLCFQNVNWRLLIGYPRSGGIVYDSVSGLIISGITFRFQNEDIAVMLPFRSTPQFRESGRVRER